MGLFCLALVRYKDEGVVAVLAELCALKRNAQDIGADRRCQCEVDSSSLSNRSSQDESG